MSSFDSSREPVPEPDERRVQERADALLPEEQVVGTDDAEAQARVILAESDARSEERTDDEVGAPDAVTEHRSSADTVEPLD